MWLLFGLELVIGTSIVIGVIKSTMRNEPSGCLMRVGFIFIFLLIMLIVPQLMAMAR
ncbi:MAG: hypothetical protein AAF629_00215 [Chloroflexota bacterium]